MAKVNFKFYDIKNWEKIIITHKLSNISRSKDSQTVKFGHLIEYNVRNIFIEEKKCIK